MARKKVKKQNKISQARAIVKKINSDLIDASFDAIENTVKAGEKWQKLTKKLVKKAEPISKKQKEMVLETAETIKTQLESGTERLKTLVGYDPKMVEMAKKMVVEHPVVEKAEEVKNRIEKEVANNKYVQKAEKMTAKLNKKLTETIEDVKEKIEDYTEDIVDEVKEKVEDVVGTKEAKKTTKNKAVAKKPAAKKVVKKAPAKKAVAKKQVAKKAPVKKAAPKKVEVLKSDKKDDLKVIKGIGPKLEETLNTIGFTAYEQLAKMTIKDITKLLADAGVNTKIYDISGWKAQSKLAVKGDFEAVKNWTKK